MPALSATESRLVREIFEDIHSQEQAAQWGVKRETKLPELYTMEELSHGMSLIYPTGPF